MRGVALALGSESRLYLQQSPLPVLEVEVTDDGHGWPGRLIPGVGIRSMRERAADLGGTLTIEPVPGGGTSVLARLPLTTGTGP